MTNIHELLEAIPSANTLRIKLEQREDDRLRAQTDTVICAIRDASRNPPQDGVITLEGPYAIKGELHDRLRQKLLNLGYSTGSRQVDNSGSRAVTITFKQPTITYRGPALPGTRD